MSSKIKDGLFMGDVDAAQDAEFLQLNGITHVVNCVPREVPNVFQQSLGLTYTACDLGEVLQRPFFDLQSREFMGLVQAIDRSLERTDSVLVHSLDGQCRSPSVMVGYLMVKYCWGLDKAHEFVAMKRGDIKLHESYVEQLAALEGQIQKSFPTKATEQQLYEWGLRAPDPRSDESVLVHTFLNSSGAAAEQPQPRKAPSQRRITWIDHASELRKQHPSLATRPERPPNHSYSAMRPANGWVDLLDPTPNALASNALASNALGESSRRLQPGASSRLALDGVRQAFADLAVTDQPSRSTASASMDRLENAAAIDANRAINADRATAQQHKRNMRALSFSAPKPSAAGPPDPPSSSSLSASTADSDRDDVELLPPTGGPSARASSSQPRYLRATQSSKSSRPRRSLRTVAGIYQRSDAPPSGLLGGAAPNPGLSYNFAGPTATTKAVKAARASASKAPVKRAAPGTSQLPPKPSASAPGGSYLAADPRRVFLDVDFSQSKARSAAKAPGGKSGSLSARSTRRSLSDQPLGDRAGASAAPARPRTAPARTRKEHEDPAQRKRSDPGYAPSLEPAASATLQRLRSSFDYALAGGVGAPSVTATAPSRAHSQPRRSAPTAPGTFARIKSTGRVSWK